MRSSRDPETKSTEKILMFFCRLLTRPGKHFQTELAAWLNCSKQSVIRMAESIEKICGASFQTGIQDRQRWYCLTAPAKGYTLGLKFEELQYIAICRDLAAPYLSQSVTDRINSTLLNLSASMASFSRRELLAGRSRSYTFYSKGRIDYSPYQKFIDAITVAIDDSLVCKIKYEPSDKPETDYYLVPSQFISLSNAIYVLGAKTDAFGRKMLKLISLAVHRIRKITITQNRAQFEIPEADEGDFGLPWHEPKTYEIVFKKGKAATYVKERIWADNQKIEQSADGTLKLILTTRSTPELESWVRSFGEEVTEFCEVLKISKTLTSNS